MLGGGKPSQAASGQPDLPDGHNSCGPRRPSFWLTADRSSPERSPFTSPAGAISANGLHPEKAIMVLLQASQNTIIANSKFADKKDVVKNSTYSLTL